jgi:hypothetical protein
MKPGPIYIQHFRAFMLFRASSHIAVILINTPTTLELYYTTLYALHLLLATLRDVLTKIRKLKRFVFSITSRSFQWMLPLIFLSYQQLSFAIVTSTTCSNDSGDNLIDKQLMVTLIQSDFFQ